MFTILECQNILNHLCEGYNSEDSPPKSCSDLKAETAVDEGMCRDRLTGMYSCISIQKYKVSLDEGVTQYINSHQSFQESQMAKELWQ